MVQVVKWVRSYCNYRKIVCNTKKYQIPITGLSHLVNLRGFFVCVILGAYEQIRFYTEFLWYTGCMELHFKQQTVFSIGFYRSMLGEHQKSLLIKNRRRVIYKIFSCSRNIPSGTLRRLTGRKCGLLLLLNKLATFQFLMGLLLQSGKREVFDQSGLSTYLSHFINNFKPRVMQFINLVDQQRLTTSHRSGGGYWWIWYIPLK